MHSRYFSWRCGNALKAHQGPIYSIWARFWKVVTEETVPKLHGFHCISCINRSPPDGYAGSNGTKEVRLSCITEVDNAVYPTCIIMWLADQPVNDTNATRWCNRNFARISRYESEVTYKCRIEMSHEAAVGEEHHSTSHKWLKRTRDQVTQAWRQTYSVQWHSDL